MILPSWLETGMGINLSDFNYSFITSNNNFKHSKFDSFLDINLNEKNKTWITFVNHNWD
jgi:hypothetical protein